MGSRRQEQERLLYRAARFSCAKLLVGHAGTHRPCGERLICIPLRVDARTAYDNTYNTKGNERHGTTRHRLLDRSFHGRGAGGSLCGLLPLLVGKSRNNLTLGSVGFVCTLISGLILGVLLAAPVAMVFTLIIALSNRPAQRQ